MKINNLKVFLSREHYNNFNSCRISKGIMIQTKRKIKPRYNRNRIITNAKISTITSKGTTIIEVLINYDSNYEVIKTEERPISNNTILHKTFCQIHNCFIELRCIIVNMDY